MKIFRAAQTPSEGGDPRTFTGAVTRTTLAADTVGNAGATLTARRLEPGARTTCTEPAQEVEAGDAAVIQPGEKTLARRHGGPKGTHLAVNVNAATNWMEPVTDEQYLD